MERSSEQSPRKDDAFKRDYEAISPRTESEAREDYFHQEGMTDAEVVAQDVPVDGDDELDRPEVEARSDLARFLRPNDYPADKDTLIETAKAEGAPDQILSWLEQLPADRSFSNPQEIWIELGGDTEDAESRA